jgi:hypothetical protein
VKRENMTPQNGNMSGYESNALSEEAIPCPQPAGFDLATLTIVGNQIEIATPREEAFIVEECRERALLEWAENRVTERRVWSRANEDGNRFDYTFHGAFLIAHLLTGSVEQAESAMLDAIDRWDSDDGEAALFRQVLDTAVQRPIGYALLTFNSTTSPGALLPAELQVVLRLSPHLRQSFVLRILVGLSREACAGMLHVSCARVDEFTCAALRCLALSQTPGSNN